MKAPWLLLIALLPLQASATNIAVALFTTQTVRSVVITPLSPAAWTAKCRTCAHVPLTQPFVVTTGEVFLGGTLRVADKANATVAVTSTGLWHLRGNGQGVDVVVTIPSERYTAAVLSAEAAANEPQQSLQALGILARTYGLNGPHYHAPAGHLPADVCDSTQCQALRFAPTPAAVQEAVDATAGETLWFQNKRAQVFFSQHCGGITAGASEAWTPTTPLPYLRSHPDPYCLRTGPAAWHTSLSLAELHALAQQEGWHLPPHALQVTVARRTPSGRAAQLRFRNSDGTTTPLDASALRFAVGRTLGWNRIRSNLYDVSLRNGALVFDGRGHGHGVGLCQAGATQMAAGHKDARSILAFYFPGTHIGLTANDQGWLETHIASLRVRSNAALSTDTSNAIVSAWHFALQRFPVAKPPQPLVLFAPTTELYRQLTGQPGWNLASTRTNVVTLQPERLLRPNEEATLRHEFLHLLIETEATDQTPLWLSEGLAEALANPSLPTKAPPAQGDENLHHPSSRSEAMEAHQAAAARVQSLLRRYGLATLRTWLTSGPPSHSKSL